MKAKGTGSLVLAMNIIMLAGFSLMQGCKTGSALDSGALKDEPVVLPPADEIKVPAPVTLPPVVKAPAAKVYSVQKGDTLSSIASEHGTSWKALADLNNISKPNELKVGQELRLPDSSIAPVKHAAPVSGKPATGSIKPGSYVIQKGDSLATIAKRSGLTVSEIKAANGLRNDTLVAGKSLTIPKKGAVVKAPAKAKEAPAKAVKATKAAPAKEAAVAPSMPAPAPLADATSAGASAPAAPAAPAIPAAPVAPAAPAVPAAAAPVAKAANAPVYEHVLYPGETLDDVARQYGSSQQEIMKLNNITDAASVKPGTKLLVPIPE